MSTHDNELEQHLRERIATALDLRPGSVGVIVGTGLVLVKVAEWEGRALSSVERTLIVSVLTAEGLGGNLYHILES